MSNITLADQKCYKDLTTEVDMKIPCLNMIKLTMFWHIGVSN